jgi:hypothetical protein
VKVLHGCRTAVELVLPHFVCSGHGRAGDTTGFGSIACECEPKPLAFGGFERGRIPSKPYAPKGMGHAGEGSRTQRVRKNRQTAENSFL